MDSVSNKERKVWPISVYRCRLTEWDWRQEQTVNNVHSGQLQVAFTILPCSSSSIPMLLCLPRSSKELVISHFQGSEFSIKLRSSIRYITTDLLRSHKTFAQVQYLQWLISSSRRWIGKHAWSQSVSQQMRSVKLVSSLPNCSLKDSSFGCFGFQVPEDRYKGKVATPPPQPHRCLSFCTSIYILEHNIIINANSVHTTTLENCIILLDNGSRENVTLFWK